MPADDTVVLAGATGPELAIAMSKALFTQSPAVVLVGATDAAGLAKATTTAAGLGVPLLLTPTVAPAPSSPATPTPTAKDAPAADNDAALRAEITRLAPQTLVAVGDSASAWAHGASSVPVVSVAAGATDTSALPNVSPATPLSQLVVLAQKGPAGAAAVATAQAAGAKVVLLDGTDPRETSDSIKAVTGLGSDHVVAVGSAFGSPDLVRHRLTVAATGVELPGGGQILFPGRTMVALYGHPNDGGVLGVLGEQNLQATITRARKVAGDYSKLVNQPVVPTFEIIATVAAASAGPDGNYSNEGSAAEFKPWVDAAAQAGIYVMLDLQPGRSDFLSQAKLFQDLLLRPNVGLALDPEWRLKSNQVPMEVIGSVDASEINKTGQWLEDLTRSHNLPQKVFMLHQFRLDMITNRSSVVTNYDDLHVVIHADGFGSTPQKFATWDALHTNPPANISWGWKNFYDEDKPTLTPAQTMAVKPQPVFVSYQ
jgi:hypothetical protein